MVDTNQEMIAVCGIDCTWCLLRLSDRERAAQFLVDWFRDMGWLKEAEGVHEIMERGPECRGCRGDRETHWSPDCVMLKCCFDDKGLDFCYRCDTFPCQALSEWAKKEIRYTEALERLHSMKAASQ